jgi:hypothetical protein
VEIVRGLSSEFDETLRIDPQVLLESLESTRDRLISAASMSLISYRKARQESGA